MDADIQVCGQFGEGGADEYLMTSSNDSATCRRFLPRVSRLQLRGATAAVLVLGASLVSLVTGPPAAAAPPVATAALTISQPNPLIGQTLSFGVSLDNTDTTATGYMPYIDLVLPVAGGDGDDGISFTSASYLGAPVSTPLVQTCTGAPVTHPLTALSTPCPVGRQLVVMQLPFGSLTPSQPAATVQVQAALSSLADVGLVLPISATPGFAYGDSPTGSTPIIGSAVSSNVTPQVVTFLKRYVGPENETATGPNYQRQHVLEVDVANGATLTTLDVSDQMPSTMQYVSSATVPSATAVATPSTSAPMGTLTRRFTNVVGSAAAVDASVTATWYIPLLDLGSVGVLDAASGDDRVARNDGAAAGTVDPVDPRDANLPFSMNPNSLAPPFPDDHEVTAKSIATQKTVAVQTDTGGAGPTPDDTLQYTIAVQVSDYFTFADLDLLDVLGDGQTFDTGFTPTLSVTEAGTTSSGAFTGPEYTLDTSQRSTCGDGASRLNFDLSAAIARLSGSNGVLTGGLVGGSNVGATTATITFRSVMNDAYACSVSDLSVDLTDRVTNGVTVDGEVYDNATQLPQASTRREADTSGTSVTVLAPALSKTIYARNGVVGVVAGTPAQFEPDDTITYRLRYVLPSSDIEDFALVDFAPLPILGVGSFSTASPTTTCAVPAVNTSCFGPADTFHNLSGAPDPVVTRDTTGNSLTFDYGDFDSTANGVSEVDVLFTLPISNAPFRDGLLFTNQARAVFNNSFAEAAAQDAIVQIDLTQPQLRIRKGVASTDNPSAVLTGATAPSGITWRAPGVAGPGWSGGVINSSNLGSAPDANASRLDAGDLVRFAMVVENTGRGVDGAYDVAVSDAMPAGFVIPAGGVDLRVANGGNATMSASAGGYFTAGAGTASSGQTGTLTLTDPGPTPTPGGSIDPTNPTTGANLAVITYELEVAGTAEANTTYTNTASITNFAAQEGGPNYTPVTPAADITNTASVQAAPVTVTKTIQSTDHAASVTPDVVVGEAVTYRLRLGIPEGPTSNAQLVDFLPAGMAVRTVDSITPSAGVTTSTSGGFATVLANAQGALASPGQVVTIPLGNLTNSDRDDATAEYLDVVLTALVLNVAGNQNGTSQSNTASFTSTGHGTAVANGVPVTVREPVLQVTKAAAPNPTDAGNTVTYTVVVAHSGSSTATAYDVTLNDVVPAAIGYVPGSFVQTAGTAVADTVNDSGAPTLNATWTSIPLGATATFTYQATVPAGAAVPFSIANTATTTWTSMPGSSAQPTAYSTSEGERTGAGGVNDHTASSTATLNSANPTITKTLVATSEASTTGTNVTIGEIATWDLRVTVPEGTPPSITVTDLLPNGLQYVAGSAQVFTTAAAASTASPAANLPVDLNGTLPAPTISGGASNGDDPVFTFGPSTIAGDNNTTNDSFIVRLQARVLDVAGNVGLPGSQTTLSNSGSARVGSGTIITSAASVVTVVEPRLQVTKTLAPNAAIRGQNVMMTVTVQNTGLSTAFEVIATDALPAGMVPSTAVEVATQAGFTYSRTGADITWTGGDIVAGATATFQVSVDLSSSLTAGQVVTNTAIASQATTLPGSASGERDEPDQQGQGNVNIVAPDLQITNTDGTTTATPGDTRTYTLGVTNVGGAPATGVVITDTLPAGTTFVSIGGTGCTLNTGASTATVTVINVAGTIAASGGTASCTVIVTMDNPAAAGTTSYSNTATVADDGTRGPDPTPPNNTAVDVDTIAGRTPDLAVTKTDGVTSVNAGTSTTYTVTVTNQGNIGVTGVVLTDTLPANVSYVSCANVSGTVSVACAHSAGVVTTTLSSLTGGASAQMTVTVSVPNPLPAGVPSITNTVTVADDGANGTDPTTADRTASDVDAVNAVPDMSVVKTSSVGTVAPGGSVAYTLTVRNNGTQDATGARVTDTVPAGMVVNCGSASPAPTSCNSGTGAISWGPPITGAGASGNPFAAGETLVITYSVTVTNPVAAGRHSFTNTAATVDDTSNGADPTPADNSDDAVVALTGYNVDLSVTKTDGVVSTTPGSNLTYSITVTNSGNIGAANVMVTDTLPAGTTIVTCPTAVVPCAHTSGVVTWTLPTLAGGGASETLFVTVAVTNPAVAGRSSLTNSVTVADDSTNGADPTPANNTATDVDVLVAAPDLRVVKDDGSQVRSPGDTVTYTLLVTNTGNQAATGVTLTDTLPAGTTFVSATNGGTQGPPGTVNWAMGSLDGGGASIPVTVTVQLDNPTPAGQGTVVNNASVADDGANGSDPTPANNSDSDTDMLSSTPDLVVSKTDGETSLSPGESTTYTITVSNVGSQDATGVVVTDVVPAPLTVGSCSNSCDTSAAPTLTWPATNLAAGSSLTRTVTATMPATVVAGLDTVTNTASAVDDGTNGADPTTPNNTGTDVNIVDAAPDLSITKTDGLAHLEGGDTPTYTLTVTNQGNQDATGVVVSDDLPTGVTFGSCSDTCDSTGAPTLNWPAANLAAGATITRTVTVTVTNPVAAGTTQFVNTAAVTDDGANGTDPTAGDRTASDRDTYGVDLSVTKSNGTAEVTPGRSTTYTIEVVNLGPSTIDGFTLTDPLATTLTSPTYEASRGTYDSATGTWTGLTFAPDDKVTLTVTATVDSAATGTLVNSATVLPPTGFTDPNPANNSATDTDKLAPKAALRATKELQGDLVAGREATYHITVTNDGPSVATGIVANDTLPSGLALLDAAGDGWTCVAASCTYPSLAPGATAPAVKIRTRVRARVGESVTNNAQVIAETASLDPSTAGAGGAAVANASANGTVLTTGQPENRPGDQLASTGIRSLTGRLLFSGFLLILLGLLLVVPKPRSIRQYR